MDKYQKYLLSMYGQSLDRVFSRSCPVELEEKGSSTQYVFCNNDNDSITIKQDEDVNITRYILKIFKLRSNDIFSEVSVYKKGKWEQIEFDTSYRIIIDFNDRVEKIKFSFVNNLADDYILDVNYQEADKEAWARKIEKEHRESLIATANIKVSTGTDLVNIYFQPCCKNYASTEIALFKDNMMIAKYKVEEDVFFKSINGLAFGKYEFILKQYDDKKNVVLESNKISFSLKMPQFDGKPTIFI